MSATVAVAKGWAAARVRPGVSALAITLLGGVLRLFRLGESGFWYDEIVTAYYARLATPEEVIDLVRSWADHAPLGYLITWALRGLGGGEWAIRLHYALAGTAAIYAMYLLGRALFGTRGGLLAALMLAVWPFAVYYSQEARPYTYLLLFSCLQALAAYRAAERSRPADWLLLSLWTVLNLYTSYLALAVTAVCFAYIGVVLAAGAWRATSVESAERVAAWRGVAGRMVWVGVSAGLAWLAYQPWLREAQSFFERGDVGFGRFRPQPVTMDDLWRLLDPIGLTGLVLVAVVAGLAGAVALVWRGSWRPGALLLLWAALPFAVMWWRLGPVIALLPPRYVMFWFPLIVLLAALGVQVAARLAGAVSRGVGARRTAYTLAAVAVVVWMLPGLAGLYAVEKGQFHEGAAYVMREQRGPATVLVVGEVGTKLLPPFVVEAVEYYFWLQRAPVEVMDGTRLDPATAERITSGERSAWLGVFTDISEDTSERARAAGLEVAPFLGVTFIRVAAGDTPPGEQLERLLDLAVELFPQMVAARAALDEAYRDERTGANMLPTPGTAPSPDGGENEWYAEPGASVDRESGTLSFALAGGQADVSLATRRLEPGRTYVLLFRVDNTALTGRQMVYVTTQAADGSPLETVPVWWGYECRRSDGSDRQGVAFTVPEGAARVTVRLRAEGEGTARAWEVELRPVR
ncbi:MAG TPA: glycosyltransferase family 39 protein [Chloroflexia bacterium]|nr:glycosyltransferase family 39 protein [Chloroflexia bacterium]